MNRTLTVPELAAPTRLDKFLVEALSGFSRSAIQQAIRQEQVTVNGKKVPVHYFLKSGQVVAVDIDDQPQRGAARPIEGASWKLVVETPDYLVVEKPSGVVTHPAPGVHEPTLAEGLLLTYPELKHAGEDPTRPGIVHRLDRDVSGLLVVARTQEMYEHLKRQFQMRNVEKTYSALVIGHMGSPSGTVTFPLARSKRTGGKVAARAKKGEDTREAITHYTVEQAYQHTTLLKVTIETGRTHQIRAHLAALGHPIVGDELYRPKTLAFKSTPGRVFLHATSLSFIDLANERKTFSSPLPDELRNFLERLS